MKFVNDPLNMEFVRLLAKSKWTQRQAAAELDLTESAVSQYISGGIRPRPLVIQYFKIKIGDTMPLPGNNAAKELHKDLPNVPQWEEDLIADLRRLSPQDRERILPLIRQMVQTLPSPAARRKG